MVRLYDPTKFNYVKEWRYPVTFQTEYTPITNVGARVITFEMVVEPNDEVELDTILDTMQQFGSAGILSNELVAESYEAARAIMYNRTHANTP